MHLFLSQDPLLRRMISECAPCHLIDLPHLEVRLDERQMDSEVWSYRRRSEVSRKVVAEKYPVGVTSLRLKALRTQSLAGSMGSQISQCLSAHGLSRSLLFLFQASSLRQFGGILRRNAIPLIRSSMLWRKHFHGPMLASCGGSSGLPSVSPRRLASEGGGEPVE